MLDPETFGVWLDTGSRDEAQGYAQPWVPGTMPKPLVGLIHVTVTNNT